MQSMHFMCSLLMQASIAETPTTVSTLCASGCVQSFLQKEPPGARQSMCQGLAVEVLGVDVSRFSVVQKSIVSGTQRHAQHELNSIAGCQQVLQDGEASALDGAPPPSGRGVQT
eukprot:458110-Pelagomonas_calceolata.AAC.4